MIRSKSIPDKVWKFVHKEDEWIQANITGRKFNHERLVVEESGKISLSCCNGNGYAWDGCSPKCNFMQFTWGTPDGKLDYTTEHPITYYASMFHGALYQFKKKGSISRKESDTIFRLLLKKNKFMWSPLYFAAVRIFGGFYGNWNRKTSKFGMRISGCSWDHTQSNQGK